MDNIIIAIVSRDPAYNRALAMSLQSVCRELAITSYDSRQFVQEWSEYKGPGAYYDRFDIVLWAGEEISDSYSDNIVYLSEKESRENLDFENRKFCLCKYSPAREMMASMADIYTCLTGNRMKKPSKGNISILGFASCCGGTGCTTVTMAVGQELSRFYGKHVMYISLEEVESTGQFVNAFSTSGNAGEYLYRLLGRDCFSTELPENPMPPIDGFLIRNSFGVEAFAPTPGRNPLRGIAGDEMDRFISSVADCGRYDTIMIDLSSCLGEAGIAAMKTADRICFVAKADHGTGREDSYISQVIARGGDEMLGKCLKVYNMYGVGTSDRMGESQMVYESRRPMLETAATVRRYAGTRVSSAEEILLEGGFGTDISRLTGLLLDSPGCIS